MLPITKICTRTSAYCARLVCRKLYVAKKEEQVCVFKNKKWFG